MNLTSYIIPLLIAIIFITGLFKHINVFDEFIEGASENMKVVVSILPTLVALMFAIGLFRASGALEAITALTAPVLAKLGFPAECISLALIRPISGSGALAVFEGILTDCHPDSFAGKVASVLQGSTETTFYTITVYYGAVKIRNSRHTLPCALSGDLTAFIFSALLVRIFL